MTRDWNLLEDLLAVLAEEGPISGYAPLEPLEDDYEQPAILYHLGLLSDGGFIVGEWEPSTMESLARVGLPGQPGDVDVARLTWSGHNFLDELKQEGAPS